MAWFIFEWYHYKERILTLQDTSRDLICFNWVKIPSAKITKNTCFKYNDGRVYFAGNSSVQNMSGIPWKQQNNFNNIVKPRRKGPTKIKLIWQIFIWLKLKQDEDKKGAGNLLRQQIRWKMEYICRWNLGRTSRKGRWLFADMFPILCLRKFIEEKLPFIWLDMEIIRSSNIEAILVRTTGISG